MEKKQKGGKRLGAGRKIIAPENKKIQLTVQIEKKYVDYHTKKKLQQIAKEAILKYIAENQTIL